MGFEPTTSSMPSRRAPSCATAPPENYKANINIREPRPSIHCVSRTKKRDVGIMSKTKAESWVVLVAIRMIPGHGAAFAQYANNELAITFAAEVPLLNCEGTPALRPGLEKESRSGW
jgi:hypothetical protein